MMIFRLAGIRRASCAILALAALGACQRPLDMDLRTFGEGFSTTDAAMNAIERPAPDARGVISYPTYQVAVARQGDTVTSMATRLGLPPQELATFNGLAPDAPLRAEEIVALPSRVAEPAAPLGAPAVAPANDLVAAASAAIDRAPVTTTTLAPAAPAAAPTAAAPAAVPAPQAPAGAEPVRHQVVRGETAYSIARRYGVPVGSIAQWNGLGSDLAVREGQFLMIPPSGATPAAAAPAAAPGTGSQAPLPPSAAAPLPNEVPLPPANAARPEPQAAPQQMAEQQTSPSASSAQFVMPASGSIIRAYAPGKNEGIDIGAPAGAEVRAADAGTVAAVTTNTEGVQIVVIKHANDLLTVYTHLDSLTVAKDARVSRGQVIGKVRPGSPSFLHFEVRRGMQSQDPTQFLP